MGESKAGGYFMLGVIVTLLIGAMVMFTSDLKEDLREKANDMDTECRELGYDVMVDYSCGTIDVSNVSNKKVWQEQCKVSCGYYT